MTGFALPEVVEAQLVRRRACASPCPASVGLPGERGSWRSQPRMGYTGQGHRATPAVPGVQQRLTSVLALC